MLEKQRGRQNLSHGTAKYLKHLNWQIPTFIIGCTLFQVGVFVNVFGRILNIQTSNDFFYLPVIQVKWRHLLFKLRDAKTLFYIQNG